MISMQERTVARALGPLKTWPTAVDSMRTDLAISVPHSSVWSNDDLGVEHTLASFLLVRDLVVLGRVVDPSQQRDAQLLG